MTRAGCIDGARLRPGFTLIELLVAMSVLALIILMLFGIISQTQMVWMKTQGKIETFRESRAAFTTISQQLSQATLNAYLGYDDPDKPVKYVRKSDLHFCSGPSTKLLSDGTDSLTPGHAVFFQAPLGFSPTYQGMGSLLNACGYFVQFNSDKKMRPKFVKAPDKLRYRLMEFFQPSESFAVYNSLTGRDWFQTPLKADNLDNRTTRVLADNVLLLLVNPKISAAEMVAGAPLTADYQYDSRLLTGAAANLTPPLVEVTLVAIDEISAARLAAANASNPPLTGTGAAVINSTWFTDTAKSAADMNALRDALTARRISFRVFNAMVPIREAKWSERQ